jgi:hypothetical protein
MYPTVGGSDEFIRLFLFRKEVSAEEMAALQGKLGGCVEEGEVISLEVIIRPKPPDRPPAHARQLTRTQLLRECHAQLSVPLRSVNGFGAPHHCTPCSP